MNKFYITTAIPYVNARPHIGHALEFTQADVVARFHDLAGAKTRLLAGGDENALKNVQAAEKAGVPVQKFVDTHTDIFYDLTKQLNCRFDVWQKGSDREKHFPASQKLWSLCDVNGDIYKKSYTGLYCVGCEAFYTKDELNEQGECYEHPGKKLEQVTEENYFFKLSGYTDTILELLERGDLEIVPEKRKNEVIAFVKQGLEDISISRSNERAKNWGVPVPGDDTQRMYVWFDALNIYQSGIGFGWDDEQYRTWWPADVHVIGKGILRFHAVYWPAFLLSAGLELPKKIFVHEYFTVNGQKMSKTLGNVIDPFELIETYGADALRYYFLAKFSPFTDGDFSEEKFINAYNSDLANGIGNLVARVAKLVQKNNLNLQELERNNQNSLTVEIEPYVTKFFQFDKALEIIWGAIRGTDRYLEQERPWLKDGSEAKRTLGEIVVGSAATHSLFDIAEALQPFLPVTAEKILSYLKSDGQSNIDPLFPRIT